MSYDEEEIKGVLDDEEEEDLDLGDETSELPEDDLLLEDEEEDGLPEGFAGLDGSDESEF